MFSCTARSILELQRSADHRSGRDWLNPCCPVGPSAEALLWEILHFPRFHIHHQRLFAYRKYQQTRERVWSGALEEKGRQLPKRAQRNQSATQSCGCQRRTRHPQVEQFFPYGSCIKRRRAQYREWSLGRAIGPLGKYRCSKVAMFSSWCIQHASADAAEIPDARGDMCKVYACGERAG